MVAGRCWHYMGCSYRCLSCSGLLAYLHPYALADGECSAQACLLDGLNQLRQLVTCKYAACIYYRCACCWMHTVP